MKADVLTQLLQVKHKIMAESKRKSDEAMELREYTPEESRKYNKLMGESYGYYYAGMELNQLIWKLQEEQQQQPTE